MPRMRYFGPFLDWIVTCYSVVLNIDTFISGPNHPSGWGIYYQVFLIKIQRVKGIKGGLTQKMLPMSTHKRSLIKLYKHKRYSIVFSKLTLLYYDSQQELTCDVIFWPSIDWWNNWGFWYIRQYGSFLLFNIAFIDIFEYLYSNFHGKLNIRFWE